MECITINQQEQNINTLNTDQKEETKSSISKNWQIAGWKDSKDTHYINFNFFQYNFVFSIRYEAKKQAEVTIKLENPIQSNRFLISIFIQNEDFKKSINESRTLNFTTESSIQKITLPINNDQLTEENSFVSSEGNLSLIIEITKLQKTPSQHLIIPIINSNISQQQSQTPIVNTPPPYSGLRNQGSTCYINSILQSLFHIPYFKLIIYSLDTTSKNDTPDDKNIPLNLQRLFGLMQLTPGPCSTTELTKSFGWEQQEIFMQHDAQEFCRQFLDNLEMKMQGTNLETAIPSLFRGKMQTGFRCRNVPYENFKEEDFYDISLDVEASSTLDESFQKIVEADPLIGDNQYDTGPEFGKQDADMKTEYILFPKILHLHLRRFKYDPSVGNYVKINKKYSYPEIIDLSPYMSKIDEDPNNDNHMYYELFGVLVHWGTIIGGHYYAYIRTTKERKWYEFNDAKVTEVSPEIAIEGNFGGPDENRNITAPTENRNSNQPPPERLYSAYMLIYVRQDSIDKIFEEVKDDRIPEHVVNYIHMKEQEEKELAKKKFEKENTISTPIVIDQVIEILAQNNEIKINVPHYYEEPPYVTSFEVKKYDSFKTVYEKFSSLQNRQIGTFLLYPIFNGKIGKALTFSEEFFISSYNVQPHCFLFWPKEGNKDEANSSPRKGSKDTEEEEEEANDNDNDIVEIENIYETNLLFVLAYFRSIKRSPLHFVFTKEVHKKDTLSSLFKEFRTFFNLRENCKLAAFRALNAYQVEPFNIENIHLLVEMETGPFLVIQPIDEDVNALCNRQYQDMSMPGYDEEEEEEDFVSYVNNFMRENPLTVQQYMLCHYQTIQINIQTQNGHKILIVPYIVSFSEVKSFIASSFQLDYDERYDSMLIFPQSRPYFITSPRDNDATFSIAELFQSLNGQHIQNQNQHCTFVVLVVKDTSIDCFADMALLEVTNSLYLNSNNSILQLFPKTLTVSQALFYFSKMFNTKENMRIIAFRANKAYWLSETELLVNVNSPMKLEFVPESQKDLQPTDALISVLQFQITGYPYMNNKGPLNRIDDGDPYLFKLVSDEKFSQTKERLFEERKIPAEIQANLQFFLLNPLNEEEREHIIIDDDILRDIAKQSAMIYFGPTNTFIPTNHRIQKESSIKIYN